MSNRRNVLELFESQKGLIEERLQYTIEHYRKGDGEISVFRPCGLGAPRKRTEAKYEK